MSNIKIGIIGGTGLDGDVDILKNPGKVKVPTTPFGDPHDKELTIGQIHGVDVVIMARHGKKHDVAPSDVNFRANLWTLKNLGCTHVLATTACGSLKKSVEPESFAIIDQYIDRTYGRARSFYKVSHIPQGHPYDSTMQKLILESCKSLNFKCTPKATVVAVEGPRYSSLAESKLFQSWGCDLVNMTVCPEVCLAAELGFVFASIAMVTDYDCWHDEEGESVSVELVDQRMANIKKKIQVLLPEVIKRVAEHNWTETIKKLEQQAKAAIMAH